MNKEGSNFKSPASTGGIEKIARLVAGRQDASLEDIARIINDDATVTGRLMERAYPRAPARETATIQMATSRVGIKYVIILYITDLLTQYVIETFQQKADLALTKEDASLVALEERDHLVACMKFTGKATGKVSLIFSSTMSLLIADRVLADGVELTLESINSAVSELVNTIGASMQAGLSAGRLPCQFEPVEIGQQSSFQNEKIPGGTLEEFYFRHGAHGLRVQLSVNPFSLG
jgi:CheY-specific phosphatase CheX